MDTPSTTTLFEDALICATRWHVRQHRKGTHVPYVAHLLAVASLVLEDGGSAPEAIAALLHDAVEDQGGARRLAEIEHRFGQTVAEIVAGCTDSDQSPKPPWRPRKEAYLQHLAVATPAILRVALADKLHNARAIIMDSRRVGPLIWKRFTASRDEVLWYYQSLAHIFAGHRPGAMAEELAQCVHTMASLP